MQEVSALVRLYEYICLPEPNLPISVIIANILWQGSRNITQKSFYVGVLNKTSLKLYCCLFQNITSTVLPAKSDSDMFCLQRYQGLTIDRSLVY